MIIGSELFTTGTTEQYEMLYIGHIEVVPKIPYVYLLEQKEVARGQIGE